MNLPPDPDEAVMEAKCRQLRNLARDAEGYYEGEPTWRFDLVVLVAVVALCFLIRAICRFFEQ